MTIAFSIVVAYLTGKAHNRRTATGGSRNVGHMRDHKLRGDLSDEEFKKYVHLIGRSMGETVKMSDHLYRRFPNVKPDELIPEKNLPPELKKLRRQSN